MRTSGRSLPVLKAIPRLMISKRRSSGKNQPGPGCHCSRWIPRIRGRKGWNGSDRRWKRAVPIRVAFVDVRMPPGWDGIETAARLWEVCPDLQIVICTAYSDYSLGDMLEKL